MNLKNTNIDILSEGIKLTEDILECIESKNISLSQIGFKTQRLAALLNDEIMGKVIKNELAGYPIKKGIIEQEFYSLAQFAGREYEQKEKNGYKDYVYVESLASIEEELENGKKRIGTINASQYGKNSYWYNWELQQINAVIRTNTSKFNGRRRFLHDYATKIYYELKYSEIVFDIFDTIRKNVDTMLGNIAPKSLKKFSSIYDNLQSENPEDWSNAVHSCRRILQDIADEVFPAESKPRIIDSNGKTIEIKLGSEQYLNRILCFIKDNSNSKSFKDIVGSHIKYLDDRLKSIFKAAQKGSHTDITNKDEASRYVIYTYMIVGDILSLIKSKK